MRFRGENTEKVTLQTRSQTGTNDHNEPEYEWADTTLYAEFLDRHGKETETGGQIMVVQDTRCKVRYRRDLDPHILNNKPEAENRLVRGTTTYDIDSSAKISRHELHLMLTRRDNA